VTPGSIVSESLPCRAMRASEWDTVWVVTGFRK
jgi:hypothetical protein